MALREFLNEKRRYITGATIGIIGLFFIMIIVELLTSRRTISVANKAFFTVDDGATWFVDDASNVPPFDHNGQKAVRAHVYQYSGGPFVAYMEKYPDKIRDGLAAATTDEERGQFNPEYEILCKKPRQVAWVKERSAKGDQIVQNIIAPDGNRNEAPQEIYP